MTKYTNLFHGLIIGKSVRGLASDLRRSNRVHARERANLEPAASSAERNNGSNVMVGLVPPVMVTPTNTVSHPKQLTLLDGGILASVSVAESAAIADAPVRTVLIVPATPRATAISPPYRRLRGTRSGW